MEKDDMLEKFEDYVAKNKLLSKASARDYRYKYLPNLPFDEIDRILKNWSTCTGKKKGTNDSDGKYYEYFSKDKPVEPLSGSKDAYLCSIKNHKLREFYKNHIDKYGNITTKKGNKDNIYYLDLIAAFITDGDVLHALTITDIILRVAQKAKSRMPKRTKDENIRDKKKAFGNGIAALKKLQYWLEHDTSFIQNVNPNSPYNEIRKEIDADLLYRIDGAIALAKEIGFDKFIQYAIEQSYFFDPSIVMNRMNEIVKAFTEPDKQGTPPPHALPARSSNKDTDSDDLDDDTSVKYSQPVDYVRTALVYADTANKNASIAKDTSKQETVRKKAQKTATEALLLAQLAAKKAKDETVNNKVEEALKVVNDSQLHNSKEAKVEAEEKAKEKLKESKYRLFKSSDMKNGYPILIDNDGNYKVRYSVIKGMTGYTVSSGKEDIFQNFRISHIWGRAYDPRFFTNLWNVVLVPAWANDLLDKIAVRGTLESKLKSTIMRICEVLYFDKITNWDKINLSRPIIINEGKDIISSNASIQIPDGIEILKDNVATEDTKPYLINIITGKGNRKVGNIIKYAIRIKAPAKSNSQKKKNAKSKS